MIWFSSSSMTFYDDTAAPAPVIPQGAVQVPLMTYNAIMAALAQGYVLAADANGYPLANMPGPSAQTVLQAQALAALAASDLIALRCFKAGAAFPAAWLAYVQALRAIVNNPSSAATVPSTPAYPAGT
jgi:hypothetical protein